MRLSARIYATTHGFRDRAGAIVVKDEIGDALAQRRSAGLLAGYEATVIASDDDWEEEGLDREVLEEVTGGRQPFIYVNVTRDVDDPVQAAAGDGDLVEAFQLEPVLEVTEPQR